MQKQDYETLVWSLQSEAQDAPGMFRAKALLIGSFVHLMLFALLAVLLIGVYDMLFVAKGGGIINGIIRNLVRHMGAGCCARRMWALASSSFRPTFLRGAN
jgi:hypothetical protein